jgi:hypothetical protein
MSRSLLSFILYIARPLASAVDECIVTGVTQCSDTQTMIVFTTNCWQNINGSNATLNIACLRSSLRTKSALSTVYCPCVEST